MQSEQFKIREASQEDSLIAGHFYSMWQDLEVPADAIQSNWLEIVLQYIEQARRELSYKAFVAEVDGLVVGSASCQLFAGLYPNIIVPQHRQAGYVWGVYVEPSHRNQGIAKHLTLTAIDYLKSIGCTQAILNASPLGKPVYASLGFTQSNLMQLDLVRLKN